MTMHTSPCPLLTLLLFLVPFLSVGCGLLQAEQEGTLHVHLQSSFSDDEVRVEVDDEEVFYGKVTTDHVLGLAERIRYRVPRGKHRIGVTVGGAEQAVKEFT